MLTLVWLGVVVAGFFALAYGNAAGWLWTGAIAAALGIACEPQRGDEHRRENLLAGQRLRGRFVLEARQQREALLVHRVETAREHRLEEIFLAAEVIVNRGQVDIRRSRNLP